jgi:predicted MPP superfamily phosphohydrolase
MNPLELYYNLYYSLNNDEQLNLYKYINLQFNRDYSLNVISDIHADFYRFKKFLTEAEFILNGEPVWNPQKRKEIIVICGDFIDGYRGRNNLNQGPHNELSLLQFIHDLRLSAREYDSYIFCTLGNHDYFAIHSMKEFGYGYIDYIDTDSIDYYLKDKTFETWRNKMNEMDYICFTRAFYLSKFYLVGYHFFLKINDTLFSHAGFHKDIDILKLFESDSYESPMFIHRKLLEKLVDIEEYKNYFDNNKKYTYSYRSYYNYLINKIKNKYNNEPIDIKRLQNISDNSLIDNLFLTRSIRDDCFKLNEILNEYNANLLVVGHCPTCFTEHYFDSKNTIGIQSCNDTRIVLSCDKKLATVDIAFSSAFSPRKKFLELLRIYYNDTIKTIEVHRFHMNPSKYSNIYNKFSYNPLSNSWIEQ